MQEWNVISVITLGLLVNIVGFKTHYYFNWTERISLYLARIMKRVDLGIFLNGFASHYSCVITACAPWRATKKPLQWALSTVVKKFKHIQTLAACFLLCTFTSIQAFKACTHVCLSDCRYARVEAGQWQDVRLIDVGNLQFSFKNLFLVDRWPKKCENWTHSSWLVTILAQTRKHGQCQYQVR